MNSDKKKVTVVGLGYVGFPLLCAIEKSGHYKTLGFDVDQAKIDLGFTITP